MSNSAPAIGSEAFKTIRMQADRLRATLQFAPAPTLPSIPGYDVIELLGRGGMGTVYKARQRSLNRLVALKLLSERNAAGEDIARFLQEAEAVGALQHPNVVQIHEVGQHQGQHFLALEYVDGGTLHAQILGKPQTPAFAAELCETLALAVHAVHEIQIVHRDLKPANILLPASSRDSRSAATAKIADFGLAKRMDTTVHLTETGVATGTPAYMAPEQVRGDRSLIGPPSDIWALGAILYEMLTGSPPFDGACPIQTMSDVLAVTPESPSRRVPGLPRDLVTICQKCLEKSPEKRYRSAMELADDLRRFREGRSVVARRVGAAEQSWRWCRRNPVVAGLLGGLLITFASGTAIASAYAWQADRNSSRAEMSEHAAVEKEWEAVQATIAAEKAREEEVKQKTIAERLTREALEREQIAVRERYGLEAMFAVKAWELENFPVVRRFLERYTPKPGETDLRGFEWHYLSRLAGTKDEAVRLDVRPYRMARLPNSEAVVYGRENSVCIYTPERGAKPAVFEGHTGSVQGVAVHPKTGTIASVAWDGTLRLWDPKTGKAVDTLRGTAKALYAVAFTPDGHSLIACGGKWFGEYEPGEVVIWDYETRKPRHTLKSHGSTVQSLAISADGKLLITVGWDGLAVVHDIETGKPLRHWFLKAGLTAVVLDSKNRWFAIGDHKGTVSVHDLQSGELKREMGGHSGMVTSLASNDDGSALASGAHDGALLVRDPMTGQQLQRFRGHTGIIADISFRPGTSKVTSLGLDGYLRTWDMNGRQEYKVLFADVQRAFSLVPTKEPGGVLNVGERGHSFQWDVATGKQVPRPSLDAPMNPVWKTTVLPDGDTLAFLVCDLTVSYSSLSGAKLPPRPDKWKNGVVDLAPSSNGRTFAALRHYRWVDIHDVKTNADPTTVELTFPAWGIAIGPGENPLIAAPLEAANRIELIGSDGRIVRSIPIGWHHEARFAGNATQIAFSPDGKRLAAVDPSWRLHLWDVGTGKELWCVEAHADWINSIAFSPRGDRIVTASRDRSAKVFDTHSGQQTLGLQGHTGAVNQAMFSHDGTYIFTVGNDSKLIRW